MKGESPRILLAVTSDVSFTLMRGFPEYLAGRGWDVHVVSAPGPLLDQYESMEGVTPHGVEMCREPSPVRDIISLMRWVALLRRLKPDLISVGTPKAGLLGILAGRFTKVPHRVYQLRGLRLETEKGLRRRVLAFLERLTASSAHRILSVSESLKAIATELELVDGSKIIVLGAGSSNGVDVEAFDRSNFSAEEVDRLRTKVGLAVGPPVIGFVGRLTPDKGLSTLADALVLLTSRGVKHQLIVIGGREGRSLPIEVEGEYPVVFTGHVSDPPIYYQLMDVLCLPTRREGFPNVVLEAAAAEVPAVTTRATGAIDSVIDGETGMLVDAESPTDLADKLQVMLTHSDLRHTFGVQANLNVKVKFQRELIWSLYHDFYWDLLTDTERNRQGA